MLKIWTFLLALALLVPLLSAQSQSLTESMTEKQLEEFNKSCLSVDVSIAASASPGGFGSFSLESYRRWTGRQGFDRLTESQFYTIAGYPEEANKAKTYKTVGWSLLIAGGAIVVGGLTWTTLGMTTLDYDDPDYSTKMNTSLYGGIAVSLAGMIPAIIGRARVRRNWSSVEQAQMAADKYNRTLAKKIRGE